MSRPLRPQVLLGGAGSAALKAANKVLLLATAVLLARALGVEGYGVYSFALALVTLLAVPAKLGLPTLVLREVAVFQLRGDWGLLRGVLRRTNLAVGAVSLVLAALLGTAVVALGDRLPDERAAALGWGIALVPVVALGNLRGAALRGLGHVVEGELPEKLLRPGLLIALLGLAIATGLRLEPDSAMALHAGAAALAFVVGAWLLRRRLPVPVRRAQPVYDDRRWLRSAGPLALLAGAQVVHLQTDLLMLGLFADAEAVGAYRVAATGAVLVLFLFEAFNTALGPHFARLHAGGEAAELQSLATWSARWVFVAALPVATVLVVAGGAILGGVFGPGFERGAPALAILAVGQLVGVGTGSAGLLLNMSGHERDTARGLGLSAVANVVLNAALVPWLGLVGAAIATAVTLVGWRLLLWRQVRRRLGLDPSILGAPAVARDAGTGAPA